MNEQSNDTEQENNSLSDCKGQGCCEKKVINPDDENLFSTFLYWRTPLSTVELDADLLDDSDKDVTIKNSEELELNNESSDKSDNVNCSSEQAENSTSSLLGAKQEPKLSFSNDSDDSDEEDCHVPIYSLAEDPSHYRFGYHEGWQNKSSYQDLKLSSSFEEDLLIPDHIQPLPPQVSSEEN